MAMLMTMFGCTGADCNKQEGAFKYYEYRSTTMREYPREYYRLEDTEEHGLTLSWAKSNSPITVIRVPQESAEKLRSLVKEYNLFKLKHSYTPPFDVRDGIMWHVYIRFENKNVYTSADNAWPPGRLNDGIKAVNAWFNELIDASSQEDIIEVKEER